MERKISRKDFLVLCGGVSFLALSIFITNKFISNFYDSNFLNNKSVRLRPTGKTSPSFIRFCEQKRFSSAQEAIEAVKDPTAIFEMVYES